MSIVVKEGDILSEQQYYKVVSVDNDTIKALNDNEEVIELRKEYVEKHTLSGSSFDIVKKVNRTELVDIVMSNAGKAMTINYNKKADEKEIINNIKSLYPNKKGKLLSEEDFGKKVEGSFSIKGEERTIKGRHNGGVNSQGRIMFIDMEEKKDFSKKYDSRMKLVDTRTLNYVVVGSTRYVVK